MLHTDKSFMPANKGDWLPLNVEQQPTGGVEDLLSSPGMSQLTVWLNEYYPDVRFPDETFQTWNPSALHAGRSTGAAPRGSLHEGRSTGVAPRGPLHGGVADLFYTDVRSILMVL